MLSRTGQFFICLVICVCIVVSVFIYFLALCFIVHRPKNALYYGEVYKFV